MRKLLRAYLRHEAEKNDGKTIKVFRRLWKSHTLKRKTATTTKTRKRPKKQSKLRKLLGKLFGKKKR